MKDFLLWHPIEDSYPMIWLFSWEPGFFRVLDKIKHGCGVIYLRSLRFADISRRVRKISRWRKLPWDEVSSSWRSVLNDVMNQYPLAQVVTSDISGIHMMLLEVRTAGEESSNMGKPFDQVQWLGSISKRIHRLTRFSMIIISFAFKWWILKYSILQLWGSAALCQLGGNLQSFHREPSSSGGISCREWVLECQPHTTPDCVLVSEWACDRPIDGPHIWHGAPFIRRTFIPIARIRIYAASGCRWTKLTGSRLSLCTWRA